MNYSVVFRLLGFIQFALGMAFMVCMGIALIFPGEVESQALTGFLYSLAATLVLGFMFFYLGRKKDRTFFKKEALAVIGLGWISACLVGALPYLFIVEGISLADAVFESSSGLSTTGASILTHFEHFPKSLLFWRSLSQWIGGLGIVVFFVAILGFLRAGGKILYSNEASATAADLESPRIQSGIKRIGLLYLGVSLLCAIAYKVAGMSFFDAVNHTFTTLSTGGFSTLEASMAGFNSPAIEWICIFFMIVGGTSFLWMLLVAEGSWSKAGRNSEVRLYFAIILFAALLVALVIMHFDHYTDWHKAIRSSLFQVVSIMTTTGYATEDFDNWHLLAQVTLFVLMSVGGCSGSTAAGLKVARILVGIKSAVQRVVASYSSRVVRPLNMNGRTLGKSTQDEVLAYTLLVAWILFFSLPVLAVMEPGLSFQGSFSAVMASFFNIGPGFVEFGPTKNYGFLHDGTKFFLSFLMIMGRLEVFAILALFMPSFWRKFS